MFTFDTLPDIIIVSCWAVFILYWFVSGLFVKKSVTKRGHSEIVLRIVSILLVIIYIRLSKSGALPFPSLLQSLFSFPITGAVLTVAGVAVAVYARYALGRNWSGYVTYKQDQELVTSGPYRYVRHPIYTGMTSMALGAILAFGSVLVFLIFSVYATVLLLRMGKEEAIMTRLFPKEYPAYMKRTKRLIPFLY